MPREDLFICGSVVSDRARGFDEAYVLTSQGCERNMAAFSAGNIGYLDMIMLDYPCRDADAIRGQWRAFEEMHAKKLVKTLAVSNFSPYQLDVILTDPATSVKPVVNQLPFCVAYHPGNVVEENRKRGVLVQAWAPLGHSIGRSSGQDHLDAMKKKSAEIGRQYGKSWAQVCLRWVVQKGAAFTTQTRERTHFIDDLNVFDFSLTQNEMSTLDAIAS